MDNIIIEYTVHDYQKKKKYLKIKIEILFKDCKFIIQCQFVSEE